MLAADLLVIRQKADIKPPVLGDRGMLLCQLQAQGGHAWPRMTTPIPVRHARGALDLFYALLGFGHGNGPKQRAVVCSFVPAKLQVMKYLNFLSTFLFIICRTTPNQYLLKLTSKQFFFPETCTKW